MPSLTSPLFEVDDLTTIKTSFAVTVFHGLNALSGVGLLSVPYALASGGWLSLILLVLIAIVAFYAGLLIQRCMDMNSGIRTYPDIGELAFGKKGRIIVSIIMYTELYLVALGFLILEGDNLNNMFPDFGIQIRDYHVGGRQCFVLMVALIILPSVWLENLSLLSYVSASGVFASVIILLSISWAAAFDGVGFRYKGEAIHFNGIPKAVSLYAFCYCSHPVFPTLYTSMKNKRQFSTVLMVCFAFCTVSYASMAVVGYLSFGDDVDSQVTLNLPTHLRSSRIAICTTLVNPMSKYALMVTPIIDACKSKRRQSKFVLGAWLVLSNVVLAIAVPFFGDLMSLVGALLSTSASIVIPLVCYLKISGKYATLDAECKLILCVIALALAIAVYGTYDSVLSIVSRM